MQPLLLTALAGTTTARFFLDDVLGMYLRKRVRRFLNKADERPEVATLVEAVRTEAAAPAAERKELVKIVQGWLDEGTVNPALQAIRERMLAEGFAEEQFLGHVFPDVHRWLHYWRRGGLPVIGIDPLELTTRDHMLASTSFGDVRDCFVDQLCWTEAEASDPASYQELLDARQVPPERCCLLDDRLPALDAAASIGIRCLWLVRQGLPEEDAGRQPEVYDFDEVQDKLLEWGWVA